MITLTKEWLHQTIAEYEANRDELPFGLDTNSAIELQAFKMALASLEAEPVAYIRAAHNPDGFCFADGIHPAHRHQKLPLSTLQDGCYWTVTPLYTAPPAPVSVPECFERLLHHAYGMTMGNDWNKGTMAGHHRTKLCQAVEECRAAMLKGADGKYPVIPDDVRRMDWLVSKTVDVREPMVYGSHSLFWSQTITDEEDDYHATKLREQIDAAMAAEQAAAPQQEVKNG
ncbi:hypothetical protein UXP06_11915 [Enterobacter ludwigii]|uniref:hypothetical protein n=1 Tax=Enterobacter ludwigii TaxID=299767 RepID=UPI002FD31D19